MHQRCSGIGALLQAQPHPTDQDHARIQKWLDANTEEMEKDCHHNLPILAHWGLVELLHLLEHVLLLLVKEYYYMDALNLLVRA